ncbi:MAG TPA: ABC transporter substrate-binding protein [Candidatus Binatia bacterium]
MRTPILMLALTALLFVLCASANAQQSKKIARLGYFSAYDTASESTRVAALRRALQEVGYIDGHNMTIEYRYAETKRERYPEIAAELVRLDVDVIVLSGGVIPIQVTKNATKTIPIVMTGIGADPVKTGLVQSLGHPGGNVTGVTNLETNLGGKRLELLKEVVPKLDRVAVLFDPDVPAAREIKQELPPVGRALGLTIQPLEVRAIDNFESVFAALKRDSLRGLYASGGLGISANAKRIAEFTLRNRVPSTYGDKDAVYAGGLMYYGTDLANTYRRIARYVNRILKGARASELPVEQPTKFELLVNIKTAKQIGLTIPPSVLARADRVIK